MKNGFECSRKLRKPGLFVCKVPPLFQRFFSIANDSANITSGDFCARLSSRRSVSSLFDVKRTMLLVPSNETSLGSLLTLENQTMPVSTDEIKHTICPSTVDGTSQIKRSVQKLQHSGLMPKHGDAITKCLSNADQICLNLLDDDAPSELLAITSSIDSLMTASFTALKLEIQLPLLYNELIDARLSSVKISNIFVDTSDGANLFAQFEITSMDHFTKSFNLSLRGCKLLDPLNVSHSLLLPPNRSVMLNLSIPLPFYAEHKREKCEGMNANLMMMLIDHNFMSSKNSESFEQQQKKFETKRIFYQFALNFQFSTFSEHHGRNETSRRPEGVCDRSKGCPMSVSLVLRVLLLRIISHDRSQRLVPHDDTRK